MSKEKILVVEDEDAILMLLEDDLSMEGYAVATARDGEQGLSMARDGEYDLVILDVMLPEKDGFEVCRDLRGSGVDVPILMLTAKSQEIDKVLGLELGADDYMTKPFSPRELIARVRAILRRGKAVPRQIERYEFGDVEIDFKKFETTRDGRVVDLTTREYALLRFLIEHRDRGPEPLRYSRAGVGRRGRRFPENGGYARRQPSKEARGRPLRPTAYPGRSQRWL